MKRNKFLEAIGFRFIVNHRSGEVHRVGYLTKFCKINVLSSGAYATKWWVKRLMKRSKKYNGCAYCFKAKDTTGKAVNN